MKTQITLIRHGETDWNATQRWQGHAEVPLNAKGQAQARAAASSLIHADITHIVASPLVRTLQTAQIINQQLGRPLSTDPRLREIDVGDWQGLTTNEIKADPAWVSRANSHEVYWQRAFPNGESRWQLAVRANAAIQDIAARHRGDHVLVVTHGGTIRAILYKLLQLELDETIPNCALTRLILTDGLWHVNDVGLEAGTIKW